MPRRAPNQVCLCVVLCDPTSAAKSTGAYNASIGRCDEVPSFQPYLAYVRIHNHLLIILHIRCESELSPLVGLVGLCHLRQTDSYPLQVFVSPIERIMVVNFTADNGCEL